MSFFDEIRESILWDFRLEDEFKNRRIGYAFVIDVCNKNPVLAIYMIKEHLSKTQPLLDQPPVELMIKAIEEQGGNINQDRLFNINSELRNWLEENIFS
ncbi:hypothetical protein SAMN05660649_01174 [Desulfotomaculum arcticum]|uniref:Uncharacterized protein n=1 Tax=Desulfotruncus arcticus DSM 17038 TaxID=1121424 RepID=A0A1I2QBT3_9FIRM|nr:hypothetical protein [Desulfotruncus arcticus]SFG25872.1 hypothetical protein SAMN05660649_01174 [Desulfotomaculum arcticum] [Desulfotruncus arcticus DSM 17038]